MKEELIKKIDRTRKIVLAIYYVYFGIVIVLLLKMYFLLDDLIKGFEVFKTLYLLKEISVAEYELTFAAIAYFAVATGLFSLVLLVFVPMYTNILKRWLDKVLEEALKEQKENIEND